MDNLGEESPWKQVVMLFNCSMEDKAASVPAGKWQLLADGESSFLWEKEKIVTGTVTVKAGTAMLVGCK